MEEKLIKYLKENKLYSKFIRNMKADGEYTNITDLVAGVDKANNKLGWDTTPIAAAFVWNATKEGYAFWSNIDARFRQL